MSGPSEWIVPKIWPDSTVYIVGGGPSVKTQDLSLIHDKRVIGVNNSYLLGDWVDVCWFGDCGWYDWHKVRLREFCGIIATKCPASQHMSGVKYIPEDSKKHWGISSTPNRISWNMNSGSSAINLAFLFGAKRIVLLGYDMKRGPDSETHWHGGHGADVAKQYGDRKNLRYDPRKHDPYERFLKSFPEIAKDAKILGLEIFNTCMDSSIQVFPKVRLEELI